MLEQHGYVAITAISSGIYLGIPASSTKSPSAPNKDIADAADLMVNVDYYRLVTPTETGLIMLLLTRNRRNGLQNFSFTPARGST